MAGHKRLDDFVLTDSYGGRRFDAEHALAYLLERDVVFVNTRRPHEDNNHESSGPTIVVFVNCSDVFAWGCADGEHVGFDRYAFEHCELYRLLSYVLEDERWGAVRYACWKRHLQPQPPLANRLKQEGVWNEWWEGLRPNPAAP